MPNSMHQSTGFFEFFFLIVAFGGFVVSWLVAMGVYHDANRRFASGQKLWFIGPKTWMICTFVSGITTAAIYWVMHYSLLAPSQTTDTGDQ
ncbi:MAG: hypothetical protein U0929_01290 [Planctomycetaceae bacterium]